MGWLYTAAHTTSHSAGAQSRGEQVLVPAGGGDRRGVEQRAAVGQGGANAAAGREDGRHQGADLAQAGAGQLPRVGPQLARLVPVDQLQRQRDVAAVLGEAGRLRAVADRQLGVLGALGHAGQAAHRAHQGAGDALQAVEVLHRGDRWSTSRSRRGPARLPVVGHDLVQGVLHQPGEVGRGGQPGPLRDSSRRAGPIAGEGMIQLADAGEAVRPGRSPGRARAARPAGHPPRPAAGLGVVHGLQPPRTLHRHARR